MAAAHRSWCQSARESFGWLGPIKIRLLAASTVTFLDAVGLQRRHKANSKSVEVFPQEKRLACRQNAAFGGTTIRDERNFPRCRLSLRHSRKGLFLRKNATQTTAAGFCVALPIPNKGPRYETGNLVGTRRLVRRLLAGRCTYQTRSGLAKKVSGLFNFSAERRSGQFQNRADKFRATVLLNWFHPDLERVRRHGETHQEDEGTKHCKHPIAEILLRTIDAAPNRDKSSITCPPTSCSPAVCFVPSRTTKTLCQLSLPCRQIRWIFLGKLDVPAG